MRKYKISILMAVLLFIPSIKFWAQKVWNGTTETGWSLAINANGEYEISTAEELAGLALLVNNGNSFEGHRIKLTADIILNENVLNEEDSLSSDSTNFKKWTPIGNSRSSLNKFRGTFDGAGHTITGMYINNTTAYEMGLIGYLDTEASIKNIYIKDSYVNGSSSIGGICGESAGTIENCTYEGILIANGTVGGICGSNSGTIKECNSKGVISAKQYVGGISGSNSGTIQDCISDSQVFSSVFFLGGICGGNSGLLNNCTNNGNLIGKSITGGICGRNGSNHSTVKHCINTGIINCNDHTAGGICGENYSLIQDCINSGLINGHSIIGGICGNSDSGTIMECNNNGDINPQGDNIGGICGKIESRGLIEYCINQGKIIGNSNSVGGICGYNYSSSLGITISKCVNNGNINGSNAIGGICGTNYSDTNVENCSNTGNINGERSVGGICGNGGGKTITCYNIGSVTGNEKAGGICGNNGEFTNNCANMGPVYAIQESGGICGYNNYIIENCSNSGSITGDEKIGSICGYNRSYALIFNSYWLEKTASGAVGEGSGETIVKTAEQFNSGEVCWLLNGPTNNNPSWYQTLGTDKFPIPDSTHNIIYAEGKCIGTINSFSNNKSSQTGNHEDENNDFHCDFCGSIILIKPKIIDSTYQISNAGELCWFAALVNGRLPNQTEANENASAILTSDITLNESVLTAEDSLNSEGSKFTIWTPIGTYYHPFTGKFEGAGHTIRGIYINTMADYQGFIGNHEGDTIRNLIIEDSYIHGGTHVGGICGSNSMGYIDNCANKATVIGYQNTGGICGKNSSFKGYVKNCYNIGTVEGLNYVGSIVGQNNAMVHNCYWLKGKTKKGIGLGSGSATSKSIESFASGEVCWLLNGEKSEGVWGQNISTVPQDYYPALGGPTIYKINGIFSNSTSTGITANSILDEEKQVQVLNLQGVILRDNIKKSNALNGLPSGIYIIDGKKVLKR